MVGIKEIPTGARIDTQAFLQGAQSLALGKHLMEVRELAAQGAKVSAIVKRVCECIVAINPGVIAVDTLAAEVAAFEAHDPQYNLDHLLADLALGGKGGAPTEGGGVKLATIHRTKGLQWPRVYLIGLERDSLPHYYSQTEESVQEERRLCFVGVCRAEEVLTITRVNSYKGHGKTASPFIAEMGLQ
jgi:superfamily I DNA/RNA helicase